MKGVFLDSDTLGKDLSFDPLSKIALDWTFYPESKPDAIAKCIQDAEIVITNKSLLTRELLQAAKRLKLVCIAATGYNNIDLQAAKELGIVVCNIPSYSVFSVAQLVITFLLTLATNIVPYVEDVKKGVWERQSRFCLMTYPVFELAGKKLGVIGYGTLGKKVAELARAFGMEILIAQSSDPSKRNKSQIPLNELLAESDFVTIHTPLTPQTKDLITRKEIEQMKPTAFLINTARGGIVNERDLAACLKEGKIAGAALDVLTEEPPPANHPLLDPAIPHLLLTPHIGWISMEARSRLMAILAQNVTSFLEGYPQNTVL